MRGGGRVARSQRKRSLLVQKLPFFLNDGIRRASRKSTQGALINRNRQTANTPTQMVSPHHNHHLSFSNINTRPQSQKPPSKPRLQPQNPPRPKKTNHHNHHHPTQQHQITPKAHPMPQHYYQHHHKPPHQPRARPPLSPKIKHLHTPTSAPAPTPSTTSKTRRRPFPHAFRGGTPA